MTKAKSERLALHWQILIAIAVAVIAGLLAGEHSSVFGVTFYSVFDFLGRMFLNALKMLIVPLIASSMIVGVAGIGSSESLAPRPATPTIIDEAMSGTISIFSRLMNSRPTKSNML